MQSDRIQGVYKQISVTPTVSASVAYTAGDQVGALMTFPGLAGSGKSARLVHASVYDKDNQNAVLHAAIFGSFPTIASVDNGALAVTAAEGLKICASIAIVNGGYLTFGTPSFTSFFAQSNLFAPMFVTSTETNGNIYMLVKTTGTPTYTTTSALVFTLGVIQYAAEN